MRERTPFEQADEHSAVEAMWHFLRQKGYDLTIGDNVTWAAEIIALVEHKSS